MKTMTMAAVALSLTLAGSAAFAQQTNEADRKEAQANVKQDRKADKAQAHADKEAHKALKSDKVKDAARSQDKANQEAAKTPDR
jgi:hypothetical protein